MEQAAGLWVMMGQPGKPGLSRSSGSQRRVLRGRHAQMAGSQDTQAWRWERNITSILRAQHMAWPVLGAQ